MIYQPEEDSYLLQQTINDYLNLIDDRNIKILDMGSGSGIQAKTAINLGFKNIKACDLSKEAIKELKKQNIRAIQSNLFSEIKSKEKFDLIFFNPPYLPENTYDKEKDTTAGKQGYEIIIKFLKQARLHLNENGKIILLFSNLSKPNIIKKHAKNLGYEYKKLHEKNVGFFEKLYVYLFEP